MINDNFITKFEEELDKSKNELIPNFTSFDQTKDAIINVLYGYDYQLKRMFMLIKDKARDIRHLANWMGENADVITVCKIDSDKIKILYKKRIFKSNEDITFKDVVFECKNEDSFDVMWSIMEGAYDYSYNDEISISGKSFVEPKNHNLYP